MTLESPTLGLKSQSNALALPICGPNLLKPHSFLRKTDVSSCILGAPDARNERQHLVSGGPKSTLGCSSPFGKQKNALDGEQYAPRDIHLSPQIPLECTCTAYVWPKSFETVLFPSAN